MINWNDLPQIKKAVDHRDALHKVWNELESPNGLFITIEVNGEEVKFYTGAHKEALAKILQKADIDSLDELRRLGVDADGNSRICKL